MSGDKRFISFEGIEGSGKSTQSRLLAEYFRALGQDVVETAEPGGTDIGRQIRQLLLQPGNHMDPLAELLLYYADRAQHVSEVIMPALNKDHIVITDRFTDSTAAYQGYARGIDLSIISELNRIAAADLLPSLTILLDLDVEEGLSRNRAAQKEDRFELETVAFHRNVQQGFHTIARNEPDRVKILNAAQGKDALHREIVAIVEGKWH